MSAYRTPSPPPVETRVEPDPFPTIMCKDCWEPTVSMGLEDRCARCDYRWLTGDWWVYRIAWTWHRIKNFGGWPWLRLVLCSALVSLSHVAAFTCIMVGLREGWPRPLLVVWYLAHAVICVVVLRQRET